MKFKSEVVTQASGSVGGVTYAHNQAGLYRRARSIPINPNTVFQQQVRAAFAALTTRWNATLTLPQRTAWDTYAAAVPITNSLGTPVNVGGKGMYIRGNANTLRVTGASGIVDNGPTVLSLPTFTPVTISVSHGPPTSVTINFTNTDLWATAAGGHLYVFVSPMQNQSINFFKGPFTFLEAIDGAATPPTSPNVTPFAGLASATGNVFFFRLVARTADARLSADQIVKVGIT